MALPVLPSFFHSHRSLRVSLKPPPASCAASPALPYVALLSSFLSLSRVHTNTRVHTCTYVRTTWCTYIQVCTTRDSSTSSTIHRVRRSTPPRFNIQTICNNFAATITPSRAPVLPPARFCNTLAFSVLPSLSLALSLFPSFFSNHHLQLRRLYRLFPPLLPPPYFPSPNSPVSSPFLSCPTVFLPPHEETWHVRTHPHRDFARLLHGVVHCTSTFHPATAITLNRRTGINI